MPYGSRNQMRMQAKINKITGQLVYLLISQMPSQTTSTPLSISSADVSVDLTTAQKIPLYATVTWKPGQFTYGEGGRVLIKVATVEIPFDWETAVTLAYAVQLGDGEVLLKKSQEFNTSETAFILTVESHVATKQ